MDHLPPVSRGGFTLTEMMVAVAISSFVLAMSLSALTSMTKELKRLEGVTVASDEAKRLGDHFATELIGAGGGQIRPWSAVGVEDGWSASGADRLTYAVAEDLSLQCTIDSVSGTNVKVVKTDGVCCLDASMVGGKVLLTTETPSTDPYRSAKHVSSVNTSSCKLQVASAGAPALEHAPASDSAWVGGIVSLVTLRRLWLDPATDYLMIDEDRDGDNVWESRIAADRVVDFQVALGYDAPKWDWQIADSASNADEWLGNAPGDTFGAADGQGLAAARRSDLRMIRVGFMVGASNPTDLATAPVSLLNGPPRQRSGWLLRAHVGTTGLRSYDIMR